MVVHSKYLSAFEAIIATSCSPKYLEKYSGNLQTLCLHRNERVVYMPRSRLKGR